jgi:hypothetical protein
VLLILVVLAAAIYGVVEIGRPLKAGQRLVLGVVFVLGLVCLVFWLVHAGILGRVSNS